MRDARIKPKGPAVRSGRELLAQWIVRQRMTQGEAADQIGISRVKLNQYLNREAKPSLETAIRIEDTTGIGIRLWLVEEPPSTGVNGRHTGDNLSAGPVAAVGERANEVNSN
jgi:transcriptional regulator with XRE-family HTH domain